MTKHNVQDVEFVKCPYCNDDDKNKFKVLHWKHLRCKHDKTIDDVLRDFPDIPTMTLADSEKKRKAGKIGAKASKKTYNELKTIYCIYKDDENCPGEEHTIPNNYPNKWVCETCRRLGKEEVDGRRLEHANEARAETFSEVYGDGITNAQQIPEVKKRTIITQRKGGGVGFERKEISEKIEVKNIKRFGTSNVMSSDEGKELNIKSVKENHNHDNVMKVPEIKEKSKKNLKKYYETHNSKLKDRTYEDIHGSEKAAKLISDRRKGFIDKFLIIFPKLLDHFNFEFIDEKYLGAFYKHRFKCNKCKTILTKDWNSIQQGFLCETCYPRMNGISIGETELSDYIKSIINEEVINNTFKIIPPKQLDIYIPSMNIAFEYNGLFYHSESVDGKFGVTPKYHLNKTNTCLEKNIRLIHIFEDEWILKKEMVKHRIKQILNCSSAEKIYARKCLIKEIDPKTKNEFLEKYHIQGKDASTIKLGVFYNEELVSVMTFSKGNRAKGIRKVIDGVWELNRFCINYNYHIAGIASKLITYFKRNYEWKEIYSYADRRWSNGDLYNKLGFDQIGGPRLNYWYVKNGVRIHRFALRKRPDEPKDVSEKNLRILEGYSIIWDCGNLKFILENKQI